MQVIDDGETSSLARLVAYCERASTEEVERRWAVGHDGTSIEEDEEQLEEEEEAEAEDEVESEVDDDGEKPRGIMQDTSRAVFRPVQVNVPHRSQLSSRSTVTRLNTLATQRNDDAALRTQRAASTRMWSSDSESENNTQKPYNKDTQSHSLARREVTSFSDDWNLISDDLDTSFKENFPSAARKLLRPHAALPQPQDVARSIEPDTQVDRFTAELLRSAYGSSPPSTPSLLSEQATRLHTDKAVPVPPISTNASSTSSSFVDLTNDISDYVVITPQKPINGSKKRPSLPPDTDDDDVVTGSGRRQRVRLIMRSLSVQDKEDDEFILASEIF